MDSKSIILLDWHRHIERVLPWKETDDPYFIWLSEIMLQQTRVQTAKSYYNAFISLFPTVHDLATASQDEVLSAWQGLGYYSRARNMHKAAKIISQDYHGKFPTTYNELLELPGIGPYTASAIASFAFGEEKAVLDGNVFRVLSRWHDIPTDISQASAKKEFGKLAQVQMGNADPADYNQAIMDFGALICTPSPKCQKCPLTIECISFQNKTVNQRPVKTKKIKRKVRHFNYLLLSNENTIAVEKRKEGDIWAGLYQLPLLETTSQIKNGTKIEWNIGTDYHLQSSSPIDSSSQHLSHQTIKGQLFHGEVIGNPDEMNNNYHWLPISEIGSKGFPKTVNDFINNLQNFQEL